MQANKKENLAIEANRIFKTYGRIKAVNGITLKIKRGEVFSLLGPNGAGKTTTVEILEGLRKADSGDIKILGLDPIKHEDELHKKEGIIPQGFNFIEKITPKEAIAYYSTLFNVPNKSKELIKMTNLTNVSDVIFTDLSGGQKQKVGLCLALANDPEILFLDEPTTGLDPQARRNMWEVIRKLKSEKRTIVLTTHYLEEAEELADRVAIINNGKIMTEGTPHEIIKKYGNGMRLTVNGDASLAKVFKKVSGVKIKYNSGEFTVVFNSEKDIVKLVKALEKSGKKWSNLKISNETLEDVFLDLVGTKERD